MRLNVDCARDLMIYIEESIGFGEIHSFAKLKGALPGYSAEDIAYAALKLEEAGFIICSTKNVRIDPDMLLVRELTYPGHQFLEDVRSDENWNKVKKISGKVGSASLSALSQIASSVIAGLIKAQLQ